jgi:hypothetical protein
MAPLEAVSLAALHAAIPIAGEGDRAAEFIERFDGSLALALALEG